MQVELNRIYPPPDPIRADINETELLELAQSLAQLGQLQPIGLTPHTDKPDFWHVVYGHRRYLAALLLGWTTIRADQVDNANDLHAKRLVENTQRAQLTPYEEATAIEQLLETYGADLPTLARLTGKTRAWLTSRLAILAWPDDVAAALHAGLIRQGVGHHLAAIADDALRSDYLQHAIHSGCTTQTAATWAEHARLAATGQIAGAPSTADLDRAAAEPQVVDQQYNCFHCGQRHSWRSVNTLVVCKTCQDKISANRPTL